VLAGSLADIVRHMQLWLVGAFCVLGVVRVWGIMKNRWRIHQKHK